jgi:phosphoribosyl 1,2-cyclic phosphodiesterase
MELKVIGSGSSGNCYLLSNDKETLILEAGLPIKEILKGLNHDTSKVVGCLISHAHMDHSKSAVDLTKRYIDIYSTSEVVERTGKGTILNPSRVYSIGNFTITPIKVEHDVDTFSFVITHPDLGILVFCTDAKSFPYHIKNANHILIEANYDETTIEDYALENFDEFQNINRVRNSHLSIQQAEDVIERHRGHNLSNVVLIHLSSRNAHEKQFLSLAQSVAGCPVYIAKPELTININYYETKRDQKTCKNY